MFGRKAKYKKLVKELEALGAAVKVNELEALAMSGGDPEACVAGLAEAKARGVNAGWAEMMAFSLAGRDPRTEVQKADQDLEVVIDTMPSGRPIEGNCRNGDRARISITIHYRAPLSLGAIDSFPWHGKFATAGLECINEAASAADLQAGGEASIAKFWQVAEEEALTVIQIQMGAQKL